MGERKKTERFVSHIEIYKASYGGNVQELFSTVSIYNGYKLQLPRFCLNIRKISLMIRFVQQWKSLSMVFVGSSLKSFIKDWGAIFDRWFN